MKFFKLLISMFLILIIATQLFATNPDTAEGLERPTGTPICDNKLKRCTYLTSNLSAKELLSQVNAHLFPGTILAPEEGYLIEVGIKEISFWIFKEVLPNWKEVRERLMAILPILDRYEDITGGPLVHVTTEIYSVTNTGISHINASISHANSGGGSGVTDLIVDNLSGALDIQTALGSTLISGILSTKVSREEVTKIDSINLLVPNLSALNYDNTSDIFLSFPTTVKTQSVGVKLNGTVSIARRDSSLVLLKDYSFSYGVIELDIHGNERVNTVKIYIPELYLKDGESRLIVDSKSVTITKKSHWGLFTFGRRRDQVQEKIMVITRAHAISFEEYMRQTISVSRLSLYQEFTADQIAKFPTDEVNMQKVLESATPYSMQNLSGDRFLGLKFDKRLARLSNHDRSVEIKVSGGGIKMEKILTVANIMLSGLKFDQLDVKELYQSKIEFKIKMKMVLGEEAKIKKKFLYNPETNKFIK